MDELNAKNTEQRVKDEKDFKDKLVGPKKLPYSNDLFQEMVRRYLDFQKFMKEKNISPYVGHPGAPDIAAAQFSDELPIDKILRDMTEFPPLINRYVLLRENETDKKAAAEAAQAVDAAINDYKDAQLAGDVYKKFFNLGKFRAAREKLMQMNNPEKKLGILAKSQYDILKSYMDTVNELAERKESLINLSKNSSVKADPAELEKLIEQEKAFQKKVGEFPLLDDLFREMSRRYIDLIHFMIEAKITTKSWQSVTAIESSLRQREEKTEADVVKEMKTFPERFSRYVLKNESDRDTVRRLIGTIEDSINVYNESRDKKTKSFMKDKFSDARQDLMEMEKSGKLRFLNQREDRLLVEYLKTVDKLMKNQKNFAKGTADPNALDKRIEEARLYKRELLETVPISEGLLYKMIYRNASLKFFLNESGMINI